MKIDLKHEKSGFLGLDDMTTLVRNQLVADGTLTAQESSAATVTPQWSGQYDDREFEGFKIHVDLTKLEAQAAPRPRSAKSR